MSTSDFLILLINQGVFRKRRGKALQSWKVIHISIRGWREYYFQVGALFALFFLSCSIQKSPVSSFRLLCCESLLFQRNMICEVTKRGFVCKYKTFPRSRLILSNGFIRWCGAVLPQLIAKAAHAHASCIRSG